MSETMFAIENFRETVLSHSVGEQGDPEVILEQIERCRQVVPPAYNQKQILEFLESRAKVLNELFDDYLVAKFSGKYPVLSEELFKLKRYLRVQDGQLLTDQTAKLEKGSGLIIDAPLFVRTPIANADTDVTVASLKRSNQYAHTTMTIMTKVPNIPAAVMKVALAAMGYCHRIIADIYDNMTLSELLPDDLKADLSITWIPTATSLGLKVDVQQIPQPAPQRRDPAIILHVHKRNYLVECWDIIEEEPYDHFLREFSTSPPSVEFPNKKKKSK